MESGAQRAPRAGICSAALISTACPEGAPHASIVHKVSRPMSEALGTEVEHKHLAVSFVSDFG